MKKVSLHCVCGGSWTGVLPEKVAEKIEQAFREAHTGEGHELCDAKTAARKRGSS